MKKYFLIIVLFLLALAFSPWLTKESAEKIVMKTFDSEQTGIIDGCGFRCEGCGIESSHKVPFGYLVTIKYKCGMKNYFRGEKRFVTPFGISFTVK